MPPTKVRVAGSGFTSFNYNGRPIAFLDSIVDSGQAPLGAGAEAIFPIGAEHAVEIATGRVIDVGTLVLRIRELWNEEVWEQLVGLAGATDQVEVFRRMAAQGAITCQVIVKPPGASAWRIRVYHGCVVTRIDDTETITVGALSVPKTITVTYTHKTRMTQAAA